MSDAQPEISPTWSARIRGAPQTVWPEQGSRNVHRPAPLFSIAFLQQTRAQIPCSSDGGAQWWLQGLLQTEFVRLQLHPGRQPAWGVSTPNPGVGEWAARSRRERQPCRVQQSRPARAARYVPGASNPAGHLGLPNWLDFRTAEGAWRAWGEPGTLGWAEPTAWPVSKPGFQVPLNARPGLRGELTEHLLSSPRSYRTHRWIL